MLLRKTLLLSLLLLTICISYGQRGQFTDSPHQAPRFWRSAVELATVQLLPWSYNRFIRKAEFAKVGLSSIAENLKPSNWEWDDNSFSTNQFAHPYHGNLYFNSFRSNGYSFWQSAPAAFAGSFIWEVAGETHKAAPNDFLNTSLGGITLGEITYRLSGKIVNNQARGLKRQFQELAGLLINPMNGLNRIIDGRWGRVRGGKDTIQMQTIVDVGVRRFDIHSLQQHTQGSEEIYLRLQLDYGNKFMPSKIPFDHFSVKMEAGAGDSAYLNALTVSGALRTWNMRKTVAQQHLYSLTMNYDFIKNVAFEYGAQSFNFWLLSDWNGKNKKDLQLYTQIGAGMIVLGAVPDKYLYYGEGRNYDYGPGISTAAALTLNYKNRFNAVFTYRGGRFQTVNGNRSSFIMSHTNAEFRASIAKGFSIAAAAGQYSLLGYYKDYKNVSERFPYMRFSLGYDL